MPLLSRLAALTLLLLAQACAYRAPPAPVVVKLIAFNDFHGYLDPPATPTRIPDPARPGATLDLPTGGVAQLASLAAALRRANPLNVTVAAGDLIGGSPLMSAALRHEPTITALGMAGLQISSVGNHEFDRGAAELLRLQRGGCHPDGTSTCANGTFAGARFQYLAANVLDRTTHAPLLPAYTIKRFALAGGRTLRIGFIGLVLRETAQLVNAEGVRDYEFAGEAATANALVPELRRQGVEAIVVLIHEGGRITAASFDDTTCPGFNGPILAIVDALDPAIDVVVSGHTHRTYICRRAGRLVTSAGAEGRFLTDIDLSIDPASGDVTGSRARQVPVVNDTTGRPLPAGFSAQPADPALVALLTPFRAKVAAQGARILGRVATDITRRPDANGETALGDLVADAQLEATRAPGSGGAQIVFMNNGGLRADLRAERPVTFSDAFAVHPFGNELVTMTLDGAQLHRLLEQQWQDAGSLLQVSRGFRFAWSASAPAGRKVDPASITLDGAVIEPGRDYRVTVTDFLASGGDGYTVLREGRDLRHAMVDVEALERYLTRAGELAAPPAGRIRRID